MGNDDIDMKPFEELVHETNQIYQSAYALLLPEAEQICSKIVPNLKLNTS